VRLDPADQVADGAQLALKEVKLVDCALLGDADGDDVGSVERLLGIRLISQFPDRNNVTVEDLEQLTCQGLAEVAAPDSRQSRGAKASGGVWPAQNVGKTTKSLWVGLGLQYQLAEMTDDVSVRVTTLHEI
jgi:hypothetical protein